MALQDGSPLLVNEAETPEYETTLNNEVSAARRSAPVCTPQAGGSGVNCTCFDCSKVFHYRRDKLMPPGRPPQAPAPDTQEIDIFTGDSRAGTFHLEYTMQGTNVEITPSRTLWRHCGATYLGESKE